MILSRNNEIITQENIEENIISKKNIKGGLPSIKIVGVGGAGAHTLSRLRAKKEYADFFQKVVSIVVNTDKQDLYTTSADLKIQIGNARTNGNGAGADPTVGRECAKENYEEIKCVLDGANILFIIAGMGGGTGTGAAPVIAQIARDMGILTISIPIYPAPEEGEGKRQIADYGINEISANSDGMVIVHNGIITEKNISMRKFYDKIDSHVYSLIHCVGDIILSTGEKNCDPADLAKVVKGSKNLHIGMGNAKGPGAIYEATQSAIYNPALKSGIDGATRLIVNIKARMEYLDRDQFNDMRNMIKKLTDPECIIIDGWKTCPDYDETSIEIEVIASNYDEEKVKMLYGESENTKSVIEENQEEQIEEETIIPDRVVEENTSDTKTPDFLKGIKIDW